MFKSPDVPEVQQPNVQTLRQRNAAVKRQIRQVIRERSVAYLEEEHRRLQEELARLKDGFFPNTKRYTE